MRRLLDNLMCIVVTICMFAFPVLLLGLAPWFGDSLIGGFHIHFGSSLFEILKSVILMMSSAGGALLLAVPGFALVWFLLTRATRFTTWFLSAGQLAGRIATDSASEPVKHAAGPADNAARANPDAVDRGRRLRTAPDATRTLSGSTRRRRH